AKKTSMGTQSKKDPHSRGGEKKSIITLVDSATTHSMCDRNEAKAAGVSVDKSQSHEFRVASGPGFNSDGVTEGQIPFDLKEMDEKGTMSLKTHCEVAEMGGIGGDDQAKNLISVAETLVLGMGLDVVFYADRKPDGSRVWGACIIDVDRGTMSRINLTEDLLPALDRVGGAPQKYWSQPLTFDQLADRYARAAKNRRKRLGIKSSQHNSRSQGAESDDEEHEEYQDAEESGPSDLDTWMEHGWRQVNKNQRPRTYKRDIVYDRKSVHNLLHTPAEENAKALKHPEVVYQSDDGTMKDGTHLTAEDCTYGNCSVCKQVRPVAPTKRSGTVNTAYKCVECFDKDTQLVYASTGKRE
ncbi:MAG: hypothetical protein VX223_15560, partial [Myxococcota bacterium]|nr:hypothetical protein [Myxococcota bacterium]